MIPFGEIVHGDCVKVMRSWPAKSFSLVVTSPPYNLLTSTGGGMVPHTTSKWKGAELSYGYDDHDDNMPHEDYVAWQRACLDGMMRLLRPDGAIFYNHKWRVQGGLLQDRSDIVAGFPVRQIIIWEQAGSMNTNPKFFLPNYEVIYLIANKDFRLRPEAVQLGCVWKIARERGNAHPAPFPVELASRCIRATIRGPVLDPFAGSGTTAIAAIDNDMPWVGIEKSKRYVKLARNRVKTHGNLWSKGAKSC